MFLVIASFPLTNYKQDIALNLSAVRLYAHALLWPCCRCSFGALQNAGRHYWNHFIFQNNFKSESEERETRRMPLFTFKCHLTKALPPFSPF